MASTKNPVSKVRTVGVFLNGRACVDTIFHVLDRAFDRPLGAEERASQPLAGGILQHGYQCGLIWGATLAAGAEAHRLLGPGPQAEAKAIVTARRLVETFRRLNDDRTDCFEITSLNKSSTTMHMITYFLLKGGTVGCLRRAARFAPPAYDTIGAVLREGPVDAPPGPVSCAAALARRMAASDRHATMAAGLAGGIGLAGGACGALGAAIWLTLAKRLDGTSGKVGYRDPAAGKLVDAFIRSTDYEFECVKIVGRKFEDVHDHAAYLRDGGCARVLDVLATVPASAPP